MSRTACIGEGLKANAAAHEPGREHERRRELRRIAIGRALLVGKRLPQAMNGALRHFADHLLDVAGLDAARGKPLRAIDIGMRHGPAGIRLERERLRHPLLAEIAGERFIVALRRVRKAVEQPVHAFEHRARSRKPPRASSAARMPDCAAQPGCSRFVQAPSARYSMMPPAMLAAMPSASTICFAFRPSAAPTPAAAPIAPKIAVG